MEEGASHKGSTLWKLSSQRWKFFKEQLYRFPGNGKRIRLWDDKIMGLHPLNLAPEIADLRNWLIQNSIHKLANICTWDLVGN